LPPAITALKEKPWAKTARSPTPHPSFTSQNSPVGSVSDKRLPPTSIAPQKRFLKIYTSLLIFRTA